MHNIWPNWVQIVHFAPKEIFWQNWLLPLYTYRIPSCYNIYKKNAQRANHNKTKNLNFEKMKKTPGGIIILHMRTISDYHMMYGYWDMDCDKHNFLLFWTIFCPFTPQKPKNSKFWKNEKKPWRYHHFTHVHQKSWSYVILFLIYAWWM